MKARPSKEKVAARVDELLRILLDGAQDWDVLSFCRAREIEPGSPWFLEEGEAPLSASQIYRYREKAEKQIAASVEADRGKLLRRHLARRAHLYAMAVNQGDIRAALSVLQDEAALLNLYPPKRTEHTGKDGETLYPSLPAMVLAIVNAERPTDGDASLGTALPCFAADAERVVNAVS